MLIYIKLFFVSIFWGGTFIAGRIIAQNIEPYSAAFLRFAIASMIFLLYSLSTEGLTPLKRNQIGPLILLGLSGIFAYNVFFFKGLKIIEAGRASLIIANNPVFIAIFSSIFFNEKLDRKKIFGIILSVSGAIIVISRGDFLSLIKGGVGWGELYIFCCVVSWVIYSLIGKRIMTDLSPLSSVLYSTIIGTFCLVIPAFFEGVFEHIYHYSKLEWVSLAYLGFFGTVLGFLWYYQGIKRIGPTKASLFINFVPVSAVLLSFFILGEIITPSLVLGTIFVTIGVYITNVS